MKVRIDQSLCQGHAQCSARAPELFPLDDDGYIALDGEISVAKAQVADARRGAAACPERVIAIVSE